MTFSEQQDRFVLERLGGTEERRIKCTRCGAESVSFILPDIDDSVPGGWQAIHLDVKVERWKQHPPVRDFLFNHHCR